MTCARRYSSRIHTLLCSNLFALPDTPNIVTTGPTPIGPCSLAGPVARRATQKRFVKAEPCRNVAVEAEVKLSIRAGERKKGCQPFGN